MKFSKVWFTIAIYFSIGFFTYGIFWLLNTNVTTQKQGNLNFDGNTLEGLKNIQDKIKALSI